MATQGEKILEKLEKAGERGVTNIELNNIAFRYGSRLHDLRKDGNKITTLRLKPGVYRYILHKPLSQSRFSL